MDEVTAVLAADAARYRAMREGDLAALEALLAEDLSYTHSNGARDDKAAYLAAMASGRFRYLETSAEAVASRRHGPVVVLDGRARFRAMIDGVERMLDNRFLSVWTHDGRRWRMSAWASTPIPAAR